MAYGVLELLCNLNIISIKVDILSIRLPPKVIDTGRTNLATRIEVLTSKIKAFAGLYLRGGGEGHLPPLVSFSPP